MPGLTMATNPTSPLLVGSYTGAGSEGIYVYDFDSHSGKLNPVPSQVVKTGNPSWLTFSANRHYLYAVNENGDGPGQTDIAGRVTAFAVDPQNGHLTQLNQIQSLGSEPTYSSISRDGRYLFIANYSVSPDPGGTLAVAPIAADGSLQPVVQMKTHRASQVNMERQLSPHVHSAIMSPDGRFVFAQDLGADRLYVYQYDPQAHPDAPLRAYPAQPEVELPPGSGPRHLIFSADGKHAYLTLEMVGAVASFDYANGMLTRKQQIPLADENFKGKNGAGALHLSPDGRYLFVTNRGTDNEFIVFAVDPDTGALSLKSRRSVEGIEPREFTFDPSGHYLLVANQKSNAIVVFAVNLKTGVIGREIQSLPFSQPSDLKFLNP
ncbi:lactonase family protein [Frateuria aurantia]